MKIPILGKILGKDETDCNHKPTRKTPRIHNKQLKIIIKKEKIHSGGQTQTKENPISYYSKEFMKICPITKKIQH